MLYRCAILMFLFTNTSALADDIQLNFTGNIMAAACEVDPDALSLNVPLGSVSTMLLSGPGSFSAPVPFNLTVICPPGGPVKGTVLFTANPDERDPTLIAVDEGGAEGIAIRIEEMDGTLIRLNEQSAVRALISGQNMLSFRSRYQSLVDRGNIVPGVANASAQFTITYQ